MNVSVFACGRARPETRKLPKGVTWIELPCVGRVTIPLLLAPLARGADGVLVLGRHEPTCRLEGAERPARERVQRAAMLAELVELGEARVRFVEPPPGPEGPRMALAELDAHLRQLGPSPLEGAQLELPCGEGLDAGVALVNALICRPELGTNLTPWLAARGLRAAEHEGPAVYAGALPYLDMLDDGLLRPASMAGLLRTTLRALDVLGHGPVGVSGHGVGARKYVFSRAERTLLMGRPHVIDDVVREGAAKLARPRSPLVVAADARQPQAEIVTALGHRVVDVGPDPLPCNEVHRGFALTPDDRRRADERLGAAEAAGARHLLVSGIEAYVRWALCTREGSWRSSRVRPVLPVELVEATL